MRQSKDKSGKLTRVDKCLYRLSSTGMCYAVIRHDGKLFRRSLATTVRAIANRKLEDERRKITLVDSHLVEQDNYTPQLFPDLMPDGGQEGEGTGSETGAGGGGEKLRRLDATLDQLRTRYGRNVVYLGAAQEARDSAPMRIRFTHIPAMDPGG